MLRLRFAFLALFVFTMSMNLHAAVVRITVENIGPVGGTYNTPVFVGFHNGSFDLFNAGSAASVGVERMAEDGNNSPLAADFAAAGFAGTTVGGAPIAPGQKLSTDFSLDLAGSTRLLLATMVLPTNDWFLSNGNPDAFDISSLASGGTITFDLNRVYDAGTEVNDFNFSAGNGLLGVPGGQPGPNTGTDENGLIQLVGTIQADGSLLDPMGAAIATPFAGFANAPGGFNPGLSALRVSVTAVPEPSSMAAGCFLLGAWGVRRYKRRAAAKPQVAAEATMA